MERDREAEKQRRRVIGASQSLDLWNRYGREFRPSGESYARMPRQPRAAVWYEATELPRDEVYRRAGAGVGVDSRQPAVVARKVIYVGGVKVFEDLDLAHDANLIRNTYPPLTFE